MLVWVGGFFSCVVGFLLSPVVDLFSQGAQDFFVTDPNVGRQVVGAVLTAVAVPFLIRDAIRMTRSGTRTGAPASKRSDYAGFFVTFFTTGFGIELLVRPLF